MSCVCERERGGGGGIVREGRSGYSRLSWYCGSVFIAVCTVEKLQ